MTEGRFFVLFGPSAARKTTTLHTISGMVQPDAGRVEIFGREVTSAPIAGWGVSMVFQSFALYPHLTVSENFVLLISIAAAHFYGVAILAPPNPDTASGTVQLATPPFWQQPLVWGIAATAAGLAILIFVVKRTSD